MYSLARLDAGRRCVQSICLLGPNDVFVPELIVGRSDASTLPDAVKSARPPSNVAPAEMLDIAKRRRREIPINSACSILNPFLLVCVQRSLNTN